MTTSLQFRNPVAIHTTSDAVAAIAAVVAGRPYALVTSAGWRGRGVVGRLVSACGEPALLFEGVRENPSFSDLADVQVDLERARGRGVAVVVALGGGSVMDFAKAVCAALAADSNMSIVERAAREASPLPGTAAYPELICVPTTAGTGSEVTKTATLWDRANGAKYSLADDRLYARAAILDASLTSTAPDDVTLSSGLDALSHAMESIWNRYHNPVSDACAMDAIRRIKQYLPAALAGGGPQCRAELQSAALLAGLAISATRTALAHSLSYPLTGRLGLRHGLACGFTLPEIAAYNLAERPDRVRLIADAFGVDRVEHLPQALRRWMQSLGVFTRVACVVDASVVDTLGDTLLAPGRADSNVRKATLADARTILRAALLTTDAAGSDGSPEPGRAVWISGLSGAGKSTLARAVVGRLRAEGRKAILLDGDEMRAIIGGRVGHSPEERLELAQRYGALCRALSLQGVDVVCATMSLFHEVRRWNRENIPGYREVYIKVELPMLIERDSRGLYSRAMRGEIDDVVGVHVPFEEPRTPDLVVQNTFDDSRFSSHVADVLSLIDRPSR